MMLCCHPDDNTMTLDQSTGYSSNASSDGWADRSVEHSYVISLLAIGNKALTHLRA